MYPRLEGLGGLVQWASRMARIGASAGLEAMIEEGRRDKWLTLRVGQIMDGVAHGTPGQQFGAHARLANKGAGERGFPLPTRNAVALPIVAARQIPQQRLIRMRRQREMPVNTEVLAEADKENAVTALRNAVVCRVHDLRNQPIDKPRPAPTNVMALQPGQMIGPRFIRVGLDLRIVQLKVDILEIVAEGASCQAAHVLQDEGAGPRLPHGTNGLREHITRIQVGAVTAT